MHPLRRAGQERLTSLPYQILLTVHSWYFFVFIFVGELAFLIYKVCILPYPTGIWCLEILLLAFISGAEAVRNFQGQKGNLTEELAPLMISLIITVPLLFGALYFTLWQTYVLRIEVITNSIHVALLLLEALCCIFCVATLSRFKYATF